jgi:hypothetical protein
MIEDPSTAAQYASDPEIGPIMLQVHSVINSLSSQQNDDEEDQ